MSKGSKQPAATTQTTTTEFPSELRPYITDILERSKARAEAEEKAGYQAYTGPRIAGFDPSQLAAQKKTEDVVAGGVSADPLLSSAQTYYAPALGLTLGQAERFTPSTAASYMSPYQQAVVDVEKREAARGFAPQLQDIRAKSVAAGGFGGSRGALLESEAMRNQAQLLSDIQTRGSQAAFQSGQAAFEAQKARERGAAGGLAAMGAAIPGQAFKEIGALEAMGAGRRGDTQRALDLAYSQFQEEQLFPTRTLQEYQSIVRGFPYTPNTYTSGFTTTPPASMAQNILGLGTGIAGLAGAFGGMGAKEGGHMAKLAQGDRPNKKSNAPISEAYEQGGDGDNQPFRGFIPELVDYLGLRSDVAKLEEEQRNKKAEELRKSGKLVDGFVQSTPIKIPSVVSSAEASETKTQVDATDNDEVAVGDSFTATTPPSTVTDSDTTVTTSDPKKDTTGLQNISLGDLKKETKNILDSLKAKTGDVPEYASLTKAYEDRLKSIGKRKEDRKSNIKKQKYLQLAQFGLNVLGADTTKGDFQIIGEAGKKPLEAVGQLVSEEAELDDKSDVEKLAILGKQAEIAGQERTIQRQSTADQLSAINAMTDIYEAEAKKSGINTNLPSPAQQNSLVERITGVPVSGFAEKAGVLTEAIRDAQLAWLTAASSTDARNVQALADVVFEQELQKALEKRGLTNIVDTGNPNEGTGGTNAPRGSAGNKLNDASKKYMGG